MKDALLNYISRVRDLAEHVRGNEEATKQSLIGPLFTLLGYDMTDPRECVPEFKADFGKDRSNKPVDWCFHQNAKPIFFVEAKDAGKRLAAYTEQLGDYFAKSSDAKLGILTNGIDWKFYTDIDYTNIMDKEPFVKWNVLEDSNPPYDLLTLLQKSQYDGELIRALAQRMRAQNLLVTKLDYLLQPSAEFIRLAVADIETRKMTESVVESWRATLASAIHEWVKQRRLQAVLDPPEDEEGTEAQAETQGSRGKVETIPEELEALAIMRKVLEPARPVAYEDTINYFKIHLPNQGYLGTVCRLYLKKRKSSMWVPLASERVQTLCPAATVTSPATGWTSIALQNLQEIANFAPVIEAAYDQQLSQISKPDGQE